MNPLLAKLQPYPFERLRGLLAQPAEAVLGAAPASSSPRPEPAINLSIGEPRHPTPEPIKAAMSAALGGLSSYPATAGSPPLRQDRWTAS